jgi:Holliday junction resolvasome RuvABC endonuclease subunit
MVQIIAFDIGIRNFAYCIIEADREKQNRTIKELDVVDLECAKNNKQATIDAVLELLDNIVFHKLDLTQPIVVLIEQQMTATMKAIQVAINVFFKLTARYQSLDITTKYLSAKHKLALREVYKEYSPDSKIVATSKYKQNKNDSIDFGLWILKEILKDDHVHSKIMQMKKKDDACDGLLMCMYYVDRVM